jgi:hypothetical protein
MSLRILKKLRWTTTKKTTPILVLRSSARPACSRVRTASKHKKRAFFFSSWREKVMTKAKSPSARLGLNTSKYGWNLIIYVIANIECTEVGRAFLIHFEKWFFDKVFIRIKTAGKFKFYVWMIISGSKSVKKGQQILKKATNWTYNAFSKKNFVLANFKNINS